MKREQVKIVDVEIELLRSPVIDDEKRIDVAYNYFEDDWWKCYSRIYLEQ